ncbi:guanine deaminase [Acetobacter sp.]|jgi:guanine deaminase|uniref:guanine deaminase n=1 Tax=Acetobacter sp. TaxID=440 RepID=UPI0025BE1CD7|nr:guanine deaminase [Acetobacter sp.]MCH4092563.1 guanine deaminase [Acetobacter sp.]MCI1299697.1 guanine deaminase [Acetobacter sp.]MCI1315423.1 guanine deaminase [Acetobacter sp.]
MTSSHTQTAVRGRIVTFRDNPFIVPPSEALLVEEDGLVIMKGGLITQVGAYTTLRDRLEKETTVVSYGDALISAGFIDTHVHYPQLPVIASWGQQLLEWLDQYIFPAEAAFADPAVAQDTARRFLGELLRAGTTTAAVYCTVHPQSVDAFFTEAGRIGARMITGKVLMDRNAPDTLRDSVRTGYDDSAALIGRWHGKGRLSYAVTPRFAITSTPEQLEAAGHLLRQHDGLYMQTHLSENLHEIETVARLFPERSSYLDVYDHAGLVGPRSIFGHGVHIGEKEFCRCHESAASLAHCPTSNLFLGSGLFRLFEALSPRRPVRVGLGTDVGAGTSLSQLRTLGEAYKVAQLTGHSLHPVQAFWLATAGGARSLHLENRIGTLAPGMEADLCVLDPHAFPLLDYRASRCESVEELLFILMTLGDERCISATWVGGECVHTPESGSLYR